jgi:asparagine N-glycosylation enzyme membrane subunit Stt3
MVPLHVFVLVLMGRFSNRIYTAYSSWYVIGTLASMQVPFVGFLPVRTSEHMAALGESHRSSRSRASSLPACLLTKTISELSYS